MARSLAKVDFKKSHPQLYRAKRKIEEITPGKGTFLAVDGVGEPGGKAFQAAIACLFPLAYTTKFTLLKEGVLDFAVPNLECLWFGDPGHTPKDQWQWRLMLRVPDALTAGHLRGPRKSLREKKDVDTSSVKRIVWKEGRSLQVLHVGPYEQLGRTYESLCQAAGEQGLTWTGPCHEVYLSDPRRTAPEKLKTIVRMAVKRAAGK